MRRSALLLASALCFSTLFGQQSAEEMQAEIQRIRQQLQQMESLQKRLEALEAQLKALQERPKVRPSVAHLSGFVQFRYTHDTTRPIDSNDFSRGGVRDDFRLRTVRLDGIAQPNEQTTYRVNLNANNTQVSVVDAFILWKLKRGQLQVGLFRLPLLYETLESNADRLTPEASRLTETLFPTERDVGIAYTYPFSKQTSATVGIFTGDRSSATQQSITSRKSGLIRLVHQATPVLNLWAGGMFGEGRRDFNGTPANYTRHRWGTGFLWETSQISLRGEYLWGKHAGNTLVRRTVPVQGGYLLMSYALVNTPWLFYGRYDIFDPDTERSGNTFDRYGLGVQYQLNPATRLNLTWEQPTHPTCSEQWTLQVQVRY